jgi:hypothetical protein
MRSRLLPSIDLDDYDRELLLENGHLRLMPAAELLAYGLDALLAWAVHRARYQLVTTELIDWLRERIAGRRAIEVGAGHGDLGYHLGIPMTDSYAQCAPEVALQILTMGQQPTRPPPSVEELDAVVAVMKYEPQVVVASWLTQRWHHGEREGFVLGPEEDRIVKNVESYIHVGNVDVHGSKRILARPHESIHAPWLVSRGIDPAMNVIYVWGR